MMDPEELNESEAEIATTTELVDSEMIMVTTEDGTAVPLNQYLGDFVKVENTGDPIIIENGDQSEEVHVYLVESTNGEGYEVTLVHDEKTSSGSTSDIANLWDEVFTKVKSEVVGAEAAEVNAAVESTETPTESIKTEAVERQVPQVQTLEQFKQSCTELQESTSYVEKKYLAGSDVAPFCRFIIPRDHAEALNDGSMRLVMPQDLLPTGLGGVIDIQVSEGMSGELELIVSHKSTPGEQNQQQAPNRPMLRVKANDQSLAPVPLASGSYKCPVCDERFNASRSHVLRHMAAVHKVGPYKCTVCGAAFAFRIFLENHLLKHDEPKFTCNVCNKKFSNKYYLSRHKIVHSEKKDYACPKCGKEFLRKDKMKEHLMAVHNKQIRFVCSQCNQGFYLAQVHARHERNCVANGGRRKPVRSKPALIDTLDFIQKLDKASSHEDEEMWTCTRCVMMFPSRKDVSRHVVNKHPQHVFHCEYCGRTFRRKAHLKDHVSSLHADKKPFQCTLCGKELSRQQYLDSHLRTQHGMQRQELCDICQSPFSKKRDLMRHIRSVHGPNSTSAVITSEQSVSEELVYIDVNDQSAVADITDTITNAEIEIPLSKHVDEAS